jgi:hypothetical protein
MEFLLGDLGDGLDRNRFQGREGALDHSPARPFRLSPAIA